jgi:predicted RNA binding protein YcfA (HicA-like mRNA interferase family)
MPVRASGGPSLKTFSGAQGYARLKTALKVRDLIRMLERDGWRKVRTRGSHRQFKHLVKAGRLTVAGQMGVDIPPGTLNAILTQAGLKR